MIEPESPQRGQQSIFLVWEDGSSWAVSFSAPGCHGGLLITESALLVLTRTPGPSPDHVRVWNSPGELRASGFKTTQVVFVISFVNKSGSLRLCDFSVQSLSHVQLFVTPWTAAHQASLSITHSRSLLRRHRVWVFIEWMMTTERRGAHSPGHLTLQLQKPTHWQRRTERLQAFFLVQDASAAITKSPGLREVGKN